MYLHNGSFDICERNAESGASMTLEMLRFPFLLLSNGKL